MRKGFPFIAGVALLVGGVVVPMIATFVTFIMPEWYVSTARIRPAVAKPMAVASEVEIIRSQTVLLPVVTNLNLTRKYAHDLKEEGEFPMDLTYSILLQSCDIKQMKGTHLIEVNVFSQDRTEAATIANEIALIYTESPLAARGADTKAVPQIIDKATPALRPARPNKVLSIASGVGMGAILGLIGVWLIVDPRFHRALTSDNSKKIVTSSAKAI